MRNEMTDDELLGCFACKDGFYRDDLHQCVGCGMLFCETCSMWLGFDDDVSDECLCNECQEAMEESQ